MSTFNVTDDLIDRRLEFLYQRWRETRDADSGWLTSAQAIAWARCIHEARSAYLESAQRYHRAAPSARAEMRREKAAWN